LHQPIFHAEIVSNARRSLPAAECATGSKFPPFTWLTPTGKSKLKTQFTSLAEVYFELEEKQVIKSVAPEEHNFSIVIVRFSENVTNIRICSKNSDIANSHCQNVIQVITISTQTRNNAI